VDKADIERIKSMGADVPTPQKYDELPRHSKGIPPIISIIVFFKRDS
jgi:hypothetical protein